MDSVGLLPSSNSNEVFVTWQGQTEAIPIEANHTVGRLKQQVNKLFKLHSCNIVGLDTDEVPLRHLNLSSTHSLIVTDPESSQREFAVAQIQIVDTGDLEKEQLNNSLCNHCTVLLKRVMYLTNQLFLHDHTACREEAAYLQNEVESLRAVFKANAGTNGSTEELQNTIKKLEYELKTKVAKVEAEKRQAIETLKAQMRGMQEENGPSGDKSASLNLDAEHEVQRYKTELERVRKERDSLKVAVFRHEKKEVDYLNLLKEHEVRRVNYETYRSEMETILSEKEREKLTSQEEITILANRVHELEEQWRKKLSEEDSTKSWEEKYHLAQTETPHLHGVIGNLQKNIESLKDFEYLYKDSMNRIKLMEKDVSLTNEYQSSLKETQIRCGLLEKEVRALRGWEAKHHELSQKCSVLEKQNTLNKEWESKFLHLDALYKHSQSKVNELSTLLLDHQDCSQKLEEAKREIQRAFRSAELRRQIQEESRLTYGSLKPQLGCEFQDHRAGAIISKIREGSPAAKAGLQIKDVIVSAGGDPVSNRATMVKACMRFAPGDFIGLTLLRGKSKVPLATEVEVGASGVTNDEVKELRRKMEGKITEDDIQRLFSQTNPMAMQAPSNVALALQSQVQTPSNAAASSSSFQQTAPLSPSHASTSVINSPSKQALRDTTLILRKR